MLSVELQIPILMSSFALGPDGECQVPFASRLYAVLQRIASLDQYEVLDFAISPT